MFKRFSPERRTARFTKQAKLIENVDLVNSRKSVDKLAAHISKAMRTPLNRMKKKEASELLQEAIKTMYQKGGYHARIGHVVAYGMRLASKGMYPFERCFSEAQLAIPEIPETQTGGASVLFTLRSLYRRGRNDSRYTAHVLAKLQKFATVTRMQHLNASIQKKLNPSEKTSDIVTDENTGYVEKVLSKLVDELPMDKSTVSSFKKAVIKTLERSGYKIHYKFKNAKWDDRFNATLSYAAQRMDPKDLSSPERSRMFNICRMDDRWRIVMQFPISVHDINHHDNNYKPLFDAMSDMFDGKSFRLIDVIGSDIQQQQSGGGFFGELLYLPFRIIGIALMIPAAAIGIVGCLVGICILGPAQIGLYLASPESANNLNEKMNKILS